MAIRSIIVDDEPIARDIIKNYLLEDDEFEIVGECGNGLDAVRMILEKNPDLIFLDIQMPEMDGFEVIQAVGLKDLPHIIFVTAYDQYAIKAFEINALDYLLKPFDDERFINSICRAKRSIQSQSRSDDQMINLINSTKKQKKIPDKFMIKSGGRIFLLKTEEIKWIEAASDYVKVYSGSESYLIRDTMNNFESKLDPEKFTRIHRSYIVNIEYIKEFQPWDKNNYIVILKDDTQLKLSRNYRDRLFSLFNAEEE